MSFGILLILSAPTLIWLFRSKFIEIGPHVFTKLWYGGGGLLLIFMAAGLPLGAIVLAIGGVYLFPTSVRAQRVLIPLFGFQLIYFVYTAFATFRYTSVASLLFGFMGFLFIALFIGLVWVWARRRPNLEPKRQRVVDFQLAGGLCFFSASWEACGLASAPGFALYPELVQKLNNQSFLINQLLSVHILMALGFVYLLLAMRGERT